jgi:large conductance mechanosensitive channel
MSLFMEFRDFIARGNVVDLAVGVIIGAAFGKIVTSLVDQIIMPPIGILTGGVDFSQLKVVLKAADPATKHAEVAILYGAFVNTLIQFLIIAFVVFMLVKMVNGLRRKQEVKDAAEAAPTPTEALLGEIRDLIRSTTPASPPSKPIGETTVRRG